MGQLRETEVGKIIRCSADGFNLSGNSELTLKFTGVTPPATFERVKVDGVTAPTVDVEDPTLGTLLASTYFEYPVKATDSFTAGVWTVTGKYEDATPKSFCSPPADFTVLPCA